MAGGFRGFIIGLALVMVISIFLILFSTNFISVTNPSSPIVTTLNQSTVGISNSLDSFSTQVAAWQGMLNDAQVDPIRYVFLFAGAMFYIPKAMFGFLVTGIASLGSFIFNIGGATTLGGSITISLTLIVAALGVTAVLYIIKLIRTGESER
jgi:hypothetical protein